MLFLGNVSDLIPRNYKVLDCLKLGILMIARGMQRTFCCEVENGWKESLSQGIVIVGPKARTRDKPWDNL